MNHDPISIAKTVLWEKFGDLPNAISYCERVAAERGELSPAYAGAALALKERLALLPCDRATERRD